MKKVAKYSVLFIWLGISLFEVLTYFFVNPKPIYWRAWEAVSNYTGKDASIAPFKPLFVYRGTMTGDLLNGIQFKPLPSEIRRQEFLVDEYGYRNRPGFLKNTAVDAVIIGSSFVGGGQETQKYLVSEMLTDTYNIPTYNSTTSVQYFWEDARFKKKKIRYVIFLGSEGEIINSLWKYSISDKVMTHTPPAWISYSAWEKANEIFPRAYDKIADRLKNYSLTRYFANNMYVDIVNAVFTRDQIARLTTQDVITYDPETRVLFWQQQYDNPLIGSSGKTRVEIQNAIKELLHTQKLLASKDIVFIVAGMPSKTHIELKKYRDIPNKQRALYMLNAEMEKAGIEYINLLAPSLEFVKKTGKHLYYPDDSHWNSEANALISKQLSDRIRQLEGEDEI